MSKLFGSKPKEPEPIAMPVEGDAATKAAADRQRRAIATRGGRQSTILSRPNGAGTAAYGNSLLGQAG